MIRKLWPGILLNVLATIFGIAVLDRLPLRVASHWGLDGAVNGYMPRAMLVGMVPLLALVMALVLAYAPTLDPRRRNFPLHASAYWLVTNAVLALLAGMNVVLIGFNLGWKIDISAILGIGIGLLFVVLGNVLTQVRPNWIFGVRTPWTLSSDRSWRETHRVGGYAFVVSGLAILVTALILPHRVMYVVVGSVVLSAVVSVVWSYVAWKRDPIAQENAA